MRGYPTFYPDKNKSKGTHEPFIAVVH